MGAMKKSSVFVAVILGCFVSSARAQETVTAKVPFAFVVGHQEFPAGQYDVRSTENALELLSIRGVDNRAAAFAFTLPTVGHDPIGDRPALVFTRHENEYRLSQIWESSTVGHEVPGPSGATKNERSETQDGAPETLAYVIATNGK